MILSKLRITKALIRLRGCAGWSAPYLFANQRRQVFWRRGPYYGMCFFLLQVKNSCDCDLRKFPYRKFPYFVKNLIAAWQPLTIQVLTLNGPIATKVVCFSRLLKCLRSLYGKQCGPRSDWSYRSSLFWVHTVCFYTEFVSNAWQLFAEDDFSRRHFQMHFFLGALRVNPYPASIVLP